MASGGSSLRSRLRGVKYRGHALHCSGIPSLYQEVARGAAEGAQPPGWRGNGSHGNGRAR